MSFQIMVMRMWSVWQRNLVTSLRQDLLTSSNWGCSGLHWKRSCISSRISVHWAGRQTQTVNTIYQQSCPDILSLINLILTLPAHSADCERGFSQSNINKNDWRSKLKNAHVSDSLCIASNEQEFCHKPAVEHWSVCSKRRWSEVNRQECYHYTTM